MKKLTVSFALALIALSMNTLQADTKPQQRPNPQGTRPKIAQATTPATNATQQAQQTIQNGQNAVDSATQPQNGTDSYKKPLAPGELPKPGPDGSGFLITKREPFQSPTATKSTETITIAEVTTTDPSFTTFAQALKTSGLANTLKGNGPYTIFVPDDKAFAKLSPNALSDLLRPENKDQLVKLVSNHVVAGKIASGSLKTSKIKTLNGQTLDVKVTDQGITVNNAKVEKIPLPASNGVIYIVDTVLQP